MRDSSYFAVGDKEIISAQSIEEAVEEYLGYDVDSEVMPSHCFVQEYRVEKISKRYFERFFNNLWEELDEDFGNENAIRCVGDVDVPEEILGAWKNFIESVIEHYPVHKLECHGDPIRVNLPMQECPVKEASGKGE